MEPIFELTYLNKKNAKEKHCDKVRDCFPSPAELNQQQKEEEEKQKKRLKADDIYSDDEDSDDDDAKDKDVSVKGGSSVSSSSDSSDDDETKPKKKRSVSGSSSSAASGSEEEDENAAKKAQFLETNEQLMKIKLSRFRLEKWCHMPYMKKLVVGCFVRIGIGTHMGKAVYRVRHTH